MTYVIFYNGRLFMGYAGLACPVFYSTVMESVLHVKEFRGEGKVR